MILKSTYFKAFGYWASASFGQFLHHENQLGEHFYCTYWLPRRLMALGINTNAFSMHVLVRNDPLTIAAAIIVSFNFPLTSILLVCSSCFWLPEEVERGNAATEKYVTRY